MTSRKLFLCSFVALAVTACFDPEGGETRQAVACDPTLQCDPDAIPGGDACPCAVPVAPSVSCVLNASYASMTSNIIGIISNGTCDAAAAGDTGALSVAFGGQTRSLGSWNPVCGRRSGEALGLDFGPADMAVFTLTISNGYGAPVACCSASLTVRH